MVLPMYFRWLHWLPDLFIVSHFHNEIFFSSECTCQIMMFWAFWMVLSRFHTSSFDFWTINHLIFCAVGPIHLIIGHFFFYFLPKIGRFGCARCATCISFALMGIPTWKFRLMSDMASWVALINTNLNDPDSHGWDIEWSRPFTWWVQRGNHLNNAFDCIWLLRVLRIRWRFVQSFVFVSGSNR